VRILIVGAGVIGSSVAFHLAERGAREVTVLDMGHAGSGMSSRSSALVRMHYTFETEVRLAVASLAYFRDWPRRVGRPPVLRACGFVRLVGEGEEELLRRNVAMQRAAGAEVELIGRQELMALEPDWSVGDVNLAAYEPASGYGDGAAVAGDFISRAREMGVSYLPHRRVLGLRRDGDRVTAAVTDTGAIAADLLVLAAGVWTRPLLRTVGVDAPIETEFHEVAILRTPARPLPVHSACIDSATRTYIRPEAGAAVLVGDFLGRRDGVDPDALPERPSAESLAELVRRAAVRVPPLQEAELHRGLTGVYDMTPDARPLIGPLPDLEGLVLAAGLSGTGFKISPAVGRAVAEWVLDGGYRTIDLTPFRPGRFADGQPVASPHAYAAD
jgi:sarcosine oxidase subunit beta